MSAPGERRLWIALDLPRADAVDAWLVRLQRWQQNDPLPAGTRLGLKIGLELFTNVGPGPLADWGRTWPVFLDLKLHDIPATVAGAAAAAQAHGADTLTIHAAGGGAMLAAARRAAPRLRLMAVTVLTSLSPADLAALGIPWPVEEAALRLAATAAAAGATGVVAAAAELPRLTRAFPTLATVVPGLRWLAGPADDQQRVATPETAWRWGASDLVLGRALTAAADPAAAWGELARRLRRAAGQDA